MSPAASPARSADTTNSGSFGILPAEQPPEFISQITCTGPIGASDPVAIVQLRGSEATGEFVLRDYANPASPRTVCNFGQFSYFSLVQLIDARHIVIRGQRPGFGATYAVVDLPEVRLHWFQLPAEGLLAVGPGLDQVLWLAYDEASGMDTVHITTSAGDHVVASLPHPPYGDTCGPASESKQGAFTHSGAHLFVLDQPHPFTTNSLLVVEGETAVLSVIPPSAGWQPGESPTRALWSPTSESLFYQQGSDVWKWTAGSNSERFLPGVSWFYPTITPDGGHLAYAVLRPHGLHDVYLVDLARGGDPQVIGNGPRNLPVFLNSTQLWYTSEGEGGCGSGGDKALIYDLVDASESRSIIDSVFGVWPATSSNF